MSEKTTEEYFADAVSNPRSWLAAAIKLLACANPIAQQAALEWDKSIKGTQESEGFSLHPLDYQSVHMMLSAFVIENLLKYLIVFRNEDAIKQEVFETGRMPKRLLTHNLYDLVQQVGLKTSEHEHQLLDRLSTNSTWIGRYPTPAKVEEYAVAGSLLNWSNRDNEFINHLIKRIFELVQTGDSTIPSIEIITEWVDGFGI